MINTAQQSRKIMAEFTISIVITGEIGKQLFEKLINGRTFRGVADDYLQLIYLQVETDGMGSETDLENVSTSIKHRIVSCRVHVEGNEINGTADQLYSHQDAVKQVDTICRSSDLTIIAGTEHCIDDILTAIWISEISSDRDKLTFVFLDSTKTGSKDKGCRYGYELLHGQADVVVRVPGEQIRIPQQKMETTTMPDIVKLMQGVIFPYGLPGYIGIDFADNLQLFKNRMSGSAVYHANSNGPNCITQAMRQIIDSIDAEVVGRTTAVFVSVTFSLESGVQKDYMRAWGNIMSMKWKDDLPVILAASIFEEVENDAEVVVLCVW
jgi:hypothetical protein